MNRGLYIAVVVCTIVIVLSVTALVTATLASSDQVAVTEEYRERASHMAVTNAITGNIYEQTTTLFDDLLSTAELQSSFSGNDPRIRETLMDLYVVQPSSIAIYRTDAEGTVLAAVPGTSAVTAGTEILELSAGVFHPENRILFHICRPGTADTSMVLLAPVFSGSEYSGCVIFVFDPEVFLGPILSSYRDAGYDAWILDENGTIAYSFDKLLIGTPALDYADRDDTGLADVIPDIISTTAGEAVYSTYSYGKLKNIIEASIWTTMFTDYKDMKIIVTSELSGEWRVPKPSVSTDETLEEYLYAAYLFTNQYGYEQAIETFQDPDKFVTTEYYVSAIATNGTILADPFRPGDAGLDRSSETDFNGVPYFETLITRAKQGGGYVIGVSQNPSKNLTDELKLSYVIPINDDWFITAGSYLPYRPSKVNLSLRNDMISYVRSIQKYSQIHGEDAAVAAMKVENGSFSRNDIRVLAIDYDGNILAEINYPGLTETNIMGMTDVYGASVGRTTVTLANSGGGFQYVYLPNRLTGESGMVLELVMPVDDSYFVIAGIPLVRDYQLSPSAE